MADDWTGDRIEEAQAMSREAGLSSDEVAGVQAWLLGCLLTHFDPGLAGAEPTHLSPERWREYVRRAIAAE